MDTAGDNDMDSPMSHNFPRKIPLSGANILNSDTYQQHCLKQSFFWRRHFYNYFSLFATSVSIKNALRSAAIQEVRGCWFAAAADLYFSEFPLPPVHISRHPSALPFKRNSSSTLNPPFARFVTGELIDSS